MCEICDSFTLDMREKRRRGRAIECDHCGGRFALAALGWWEVNGVPAIALCIGCEALVRGDGNELVRIP